MNRLPFTLALRELRHGRRFALSFILNVALGLVGFLTLDAFKVSVDDSIRVRSKALLAADLSVSGRRDLTAEEEKLIAVAVPFVDSSRVVEFFTMAVRVGQTGASRLVQVKVIEPSYPFYGELTLENGDTGKRPALAKNGAAWVSPELLPQLGASRGDSLKLGDAVLRIVDIVRHDPATGSSFLALSPKVYVSRADLPAMNLIRPGGSVSYSRLYRLPPTANVKAIASALNRQLTDPALRVLSPQEASDQVARAGRYLGDYLGLATLVAFFLASVGSAYLFRSFLGVRAREVAVLRALGMQPAEAVRSYSFQLALMGFAALIPAALISALLLPLTADVLAAFFPFRLTPTLSWRSVGLAAILSSVGSWLVCLPLLTRLRHLKPVQLLGDGDVSLPSSGNEWIWLLPALLFYWGLSVWQSQSWIVGSLFLAGLTVATAGVLGAGAICLKALERTRTKQLFLRLGLRQLARQKVATLSCLLALSLGVLLVNLIGQIQYGLKAQLTIDVPGRSLPSLFLFDIQEDQKDGLVKLLDAERAPATRISPMIRGRLVAVNGAPFGKVDGPEGVESREEEVERRFRNRGLNLTYRERLTDSEEIVSGEDVSHAIGKPVVSVEKDYAKRMKLKLGDSLTLDIQGVEIVSEIANLRRVRWSSFQPNFFIQFPPGVLDEAPKTFIASVSKLSLDDKIRVQSKIVSAFPNVSLVDVSELVGRILGILEQMAWAMRAMAALSLVVGSVVLVSIAAHQARQRRRDTALLKVLGAEFSKVRALWSFEFGLLGTLAAGLGLAASLGLSYLFAELVFDSRWLVDWRWPLFSAFIVPAVTAGLASVATRSALRESPQSLLQQR